MIATQFAGALDAAFGGRITWAGDTIKMALLTAAGTPDPLGWSNFSDATHEVVGQGYAAGGLTLTAPTHGVTTANSWGTAWSPTTTYAPGQIIRPATPNGRLYQCVGAGVTGSFAGVMNAASGVQGSTTLDGSVTWSCLGRAIAQWGSDAAKWTNATMSASYAVIYDAQTGNPATSPLICFIDFGGSVVSTNGDYTVTPNALGWFWFATA